MTVKKNKGSYLYGENYILVYNLFQRPWLLRYKMNLKCTNLAFSSAAAKAAASASAASASALALASASVSALAFASASASACSASSLKQLFMCEFKQIKAKLF